MRVASSRPWASSASTSSGISSSSTNVAARSLQLLLGGRQAEIHGASPSRTMSASSATAAPPATRSGLMSMAAMSGRWLASRPSATSTPAIARRSASSRPRASGLHEATSANASSGVERRERRDGRLGERLGQRAADAADDERADLRVAHDAAQHLGAAAQVLADDHGAADPLGGGACRGRCQAPEHHASVALLVRRAEPLDHDGRAERDRGVRGCGRRRGLVLERSVDAVAGQHLAARVLVDVPRDVVELGQVRRRARIAGLADARLPAREGADRAQRRARALQHRHAGGARGAERGRVGVGGRARDDRRERAVRSGGDGRVDGRARPPARRARSAATARRRAAGPRPPGALHRRARSRGRAPRPARPPSSRSGCPAAASGWAPASASARSEGSGASSSPAASAASATRPPSPPEFVSATSRVPRGRTGAERLEVLEPVRHVGHGDRAVRGAQRRERLRRADDGARVREGGARGGLRAPAREHDHRLLGARGEREALGERRGTAHRLEREADHRRLVVGGERREPVRGVPADLVAARHDSAQAEAGAGVQQRLAERARVHDAGHAARRSACGTLPIHAEAPPGTATPMQFGPTSGTFAWAQSTESSARATLPASPSSGPRPGTTSRRLPRAIAARAPATTARAPIASAQTSGANGSSSMLVTTRAPTAGPARAMDGDGLGANPQVRPEVESCAVIRRPDDGSGACAQRDAEVAARALRHAARARRRCSSSSSRGSGARNPGSSR